MSTTIEIVRALWQAPPGTEGAHHARRAVLDTAGTMLAGRTSHQAATVARAVAAGGGQGVAARALVLGTAAHALDFDDYEDVGSTHPSAPILGALFACLPQTAASLGDLLRAYVAGYEAILSLGRALTHAHYLRGWHATGTLGAAGAAVAVARLLDLSAAQGGAALSIALTRAGGLKRQFGSDVKALHAGLAAETGVLAGLLAAQGMRAETDLLTGPDGFLSLMGGVSQDWADAAPLRITDHPPYAKPWPSCGYTHRAIEAALELSRQLGPGGTPSIAAARLEMPDAYLSVAGFRAPKTEAQARFSATYCVAAALARGALGPLDFEPDAFQDPDVQALEARVEALAYPLPPGAGDMHPDSPDRLSLTLTDGRELSVSVGAVRGGPGKMLSDAELTAKFTACGGRPKDAQAFWTARPDAPFTLFSGLHS